MARAVARNEEAYNLDLANLGRLRQRILTESRISREEAIELVDYIDKLSMAIRPFLPTDGE